jgi:Phosphotransferase enzyme family
VLTHQQLPMTVEDLTPSWLTMAMGERLAGVSVESVDVSNVIWGTATKVLLRVSYSADPGPDGPPEKLCVKGGFDPKMRNLGLATAYRREADFFAFLAPSLDVPLPRCWFAGADMDLGQGVVVLDDLAATGCTFGEPLQAWSPDLVSDALEVQATWHGATWGAQPDRYPWLSSGTPVRDVADVMLGAAYWDQHFTSADAPAVPQLFLDRERMQRAFTAMWRLDDAATPCVLHADPHVGNTYVDAGGHPAFIDWQAVCAAPALDDVTYFIGGALSVQDRRKHERGLLAHYLDALAGSGGPRLEFDTAWLDYRRHQVHGFLWATTGPTQQTPERVSAMTERHVAAMEDLESFEALGV